MTKQKKKKIFIRGILKMHPRGFGFLIPEDKEKFPEDIFIPKTATKGAIDGDTVQVELNQEAVSDKGPEGSVETILERGRSQVAGTITTVFSKGDALAYVPLLGVNTRMRVQKGKKKFRVGDRLIIKVLKWGKESVGEMSSYLGHMSEPSCDVSALIEEFEIHETFSASSLQEAKDFGKTVNKKELEGREDFRELETFTIDPETAKDFDDALSLSKDSEGNFHLGVHIADVSHYVKPGTSLDKEAKERCNSVYFPGTVVPMLPHELSSHLCSLKPHANRLTISVLIVLDPNGTVLNYRIVKSVIWSQTRFTYLEAKQVLDGLKKSKHQETLFLMVDLCHRLKQKRAQRGSIEFSVPGISVKVDSKGMPLGIDIVEYDITHQLVEEFMLKANEIVATHLSQQGIALPYRVHDEPNADNIKDFALLAHAFGFKISKEPTNQELQHLFDDATHSPFAPLLATSFIRSMKLANYSTQNIGHYGLGLDYYTHFTSPIRRYIDLLVHRALFHEIQGENLEKLALQCSEKERLSMKAENAAILLKKLRLLDASFKKFPHKNYAAVITSIKPFGIIFEVTDFYLEGFIPLSKLTDDYFHYDVKRRRLVGEKTHVSFRAGDAIQVQLLELDLILQETKWGIAKQKTKK